MEQAKQQGPWNVGQALIKLGEQQVSKQKVVFWGQHRRRGLAGRSGKVDLGLHCSSQSSTALNRNQPRVSVSGRPFWCVEQTRENIMESGEPQQAAAPGWRKTCQTEPKAGRARKN